ncbi:MAG TPA: polysaccharide pyruvyl transferase family protein [Sphingomonas sp.]
MPADAHALSRSANAVIAELDDRIDRTIAPLLDGAPVALVDFPDHANVGDSAIWMGERAFFDRHGAAIAYCSSLKTHAAEDLKAHLPGGTVFLHGGGNFGTIWKAHQDLRIDTLARLRDHAIVQLPQSLFFDDDAAVTETARAIEAHGRFTLCVRDVPSFEFAQRHFQCEILLCPDMAIAIGPLPRKQPRVDVFGLLRTDRERSLSVGALGTGDRIETGDWLDESRNAMRLTSAGSRLLTIGSDAAAARLTKYDRLAKARINRGIGMLSSGRVVITDRLHGHIMSTLLDIPHVALDNSYRKIGNFIDCWTHDVDIVRTATTIDAALQQADGLLAELSAKAERALR